VETSGQPGSNEKRFGAEQHLVLARLLALGLVLCVSLLEPARTKPTLAYPLSAVALVMGLFVYALEPHRLFPVLRASSLGIVFDCLVGLPILFATGGVDSGISVAMAVGIITRGLSPNPRVLYLAAAAYGATYVGALGLLGQLLAHAPSVVAQVAILFLVARITALVGRSLQAPAPKPSANDPERVWDRSLAERLSSVRTLAAGVAHEINNPLAFVTANLEYICSELERSPVPGEAGDELVRAAAEGLVGATRMRDIVRDLRTFARTEDSAGPVVVGEVVDLTVKLAWTEVSPRARLIRDVDETLQVHANAGRLSQVLWNLIVNAAHAIPTGDVEGNEIRISAHAKGTVARIEVRDTGAGIPLEHLPRIFDPFFTTKPVGRGTGLGLAMCHSIVQGLGGEIRVQSMPGQGTTLTVELPLLKGAQPLKRTASAPLPARSGR
jgi:signal transduction histidine kinase